MTSRTRRGALAAIASLPLLSAAAQPPVARGVTGFGGVRLNVLSLGEGRPTLLLHGFLSDANSWFRTGLVSRLAESGRRVVAPDFRAHGASEAPDDPAQYPPDVLAFDIEALLGAETAGGYDVVGYSMGALVAVRLLVRGARPGKVVLGGMGDARIIGLTPRDAAFRDGATNGAQATTDLARGVAARIAQGGMKPQAILAILQSLERTSPAVLKTLKTPTLVVCGDRDDDNGSAEGLAAALGDARAVRVPGAHGTAPATAPFIDAVLSHLG